MAPPPALSELPPPPPGLRGWPWTEASPPWPKRLLAGQCWPRLSLVTPSLNQGRFLEETLRSVLLQGYPNLEYVVVDGGSTDGSVSILERYAPWLDHWDSRPDGGHYEALVRGFARTSGELMAWINSDDKYAPGALRTMAEVFVRWPQVEWLTSLWPIRWGEDGGKLRCRRLPGFSREAFLRGEYVAGVAPFHSAWIQQESTFWRRHLWRRAGGRLDAALRLAGDFELWSRFYRHAELYGVRARLGGFRVHAEQQTALGMPLYVAEARQVLRRCGGEPNSAVRAAIRACITRWPASLRRPLVALGWAYDGRIIVRDRHDGWRIAETAV